VDERLLEELEAARQVLLVCQSVLEATAFVSSAMLQDLWARQGESQDYLLDPFGLLVYRRLQEYL